MNGLSLASSIFKQSVHTFHIDFSSRHTPQYMIVDPSQLDMKHRTTVKYRLSTKSTYTLSRLRQIYYSLYVYGFPCFIVGRRLHHQ